MDDILFDLYYSSVHRNEELELTIEELQNDLKQAQNEVKLLNKQCDKLIAENNDLKHRRKILVKHLLNIMYGFDYVDTGCIKAESEE